MLWSHQLSQKPAFPYSFISYKWLGSGGSGVPNKEQERRYSSTADEEEDHACTNMLIGALCLELTGWGYWQV